MRDLKRLSIKFTEFKRLFIDGDHSTGRRVDDEYKWFFNWNDLIWHDECLISLRSDLATLRDLMNN